MRGSRMELCIQKERLTRRKHHWGAVGDFRNIYARRLPALRQPIDVLVECFSSDREVEKLHSYDEELADVLKGLA